ncbi:signal transduction histidine kinase/ligand-binding sensor domain-containing protein [Duganella sp. 1224]|uniref:sensor histidine kinase n=1 Tax=Duganella sp. 1224 TaxID=2587052 RepID=UPI0015CAF5F6|nr:sensor histidine kinase [Duganella sp. 1224]NYE59418.1 signal transduction histidine kinase/ligand-binding sensor domain-containing protein [Duganella sp. 1224]
MLSLFVRLCWMAMMLCQAVTAAAAAPPMWHSALHHQGWSQKDGAPADVLFMTQAADGRMLFAAHDGLYRFDGVAFERIEQIDGNRLQSSNLMSISSFDGALWVTYQFGGISRFKAGQARHYGEADGLPPSAVHHVDLSPGGIMWAATSRGLYWLEGQRWRHAGAEHGLPDGFAGAFNFTRDGGIITYIGDHMYRSAAGEPRFRLVLTMAGLEGGDDRPDGSIWLYSQRSGITAYDPASGALRKVTLPGKRRIYSYRSDERGAFWLNTGNSIELLDRDMRPLRSFNRAQGFTDDTYLNMFDDREGNLWFSTRRGIDRLRETKLSTVALPSTYDSPLVSAGADGTVWIGGSYGADSFGIAADGTRLPGGIKEVAAALRAPDGAMWFGTDSALWRQAGKTTQQWKLPDALTGFRVQAMALAPDGTLWLSVLGHGVHTFRDGVWTARGGIDALGKETPIWVHADGRGRIWFGYTNSRVVMLSRGRLTRYGGAQGLDIGNVLALYSGAQRLWAGGEKGLAYLDGGRFVPWLRPDGSAFRGVSGIVETPAGELWLHHVDGISRIAARDIGAQGAAAVEDFNHLDGLQGLPSQISPLPSLTGGTDGRIWYATGASVGWIDPAHILRNVHAPHVMVRSLATDTASYAADTAPVLPQGTRALQIRFTASALAMPERVRFRYRLSGVDPGWRDPGQNRVAYYTNLEPGDYTFEVSAANEDGVWSASAERVRFSIQPAFTQTIAFKLLCAAGVAGLLVLLFHWRMRQLTLRMQERLEERLDERERIARALHDTFLQSLQGLILRVDGIRDRVRDDGTSRQMVDQILDDADRLVDEGRSEVLGLRGGPGAQDGLAPALARVGQSMTAQFGAAFQVHNDGTPRLLRADVLDELIFIGREAIMNAFRHAQAAHIGVDISYGDDQLVLTVRDDGVGMAADAGQTATAQRHFGLTGMRERAHRIDGEFALHSTAGGGTTVRVSVAAKSAYQLAPRRRWGWR